jgi:hypothetical protein
MGKLAAKGSASLGYAKREKWKFLQVSVTQPEANETPGRTTHTHLSSSPSTSHRRGKAESSLDLSLSLSVAALQNNDKPC